MKDKEKKKKFISTLAYYGARATRLSYRQEMKLREWILPYLLDEFDLSGGPMSIQDLRVFVDEWEHPDLNPQDYKYYYVNKNNSQGKSLRDFFGI